MTEVGHADGARRDQSDTAASEALVEWVKAAQGRIDVLFVNAGVAHFAGLGGVDEAKTRAPMKCIDRPEEVAAAVLFLASDATFVTGEELIVGGVW